jgi:hypothetical protein
VLAFDLDCDYRGWRLSAITLETATCFDTEAHLGDAVVGGKLCR